LYEKDKYPYALFMGHLAVEKLLNAIVVNETQKHAPHSHALLLLAETTKIKIPQKFKKKLARFMKFHIEARYPAQQNDFYKKCTKEFTAKNLFEIKEVYAWLKKKL